MEPERIFDIQSSTEFDRLALETFREQYREVPVYREFCDYLGRNPSGVDTPEKIPFLPIEIFKTRKVLRRGRSAETVFTSSGTTSATLSRHYVSSLALYRESFIRGFEASYGPASAYCLLALLPSYQERPGSSLIYMVSELISRTGHPQSGFVQAGDDTLYRLLRQLEGTGLKILLLGVSFALLDLATQNPRPLENTLVMETGGMKGRRREMVREELHQKLCSGFGLDTIHSEYGMTELLSQAYSPGNGRFRCPPWMRVHIRDTEDPFAFLGTKQTGGISIIDLANQHSCAFLATQDLGRLHDDGSFEVLGRFDHSDIRGCNLMAL